MRHPFVYIVDDDRDDIELLVATINSVNHNIDCVISHDGEEALKTIQDLILLPDVILLDLNMPRLDGKGFLKEIKQNKTLSQIPVIIYTTSTSERDKAETKELGAFSYIIKPDNYTGLVAVAKTIIAEVA